MTLKLGIHMWPISSNNIPTQQDCKQQQIASDNQFINKLNVPITNNISSSSHESWYVCARQCQQHTINITGLSTTTNSLRQLIKKLNVPITT